MPTYSILVILLWNNRNFQILCVCNNAILLLMKRWKVNGLSQDLYSSPYKAYRWFCFWSVKCGDMRLYGFTRFNGSLGLARATPNRQIASKRVISVGLCNRCFQLVETQGLVRNLTAPGLYLPSTRKPWKFCPWKRSPSSYVLLVLSVRRFAGKTLSVGHIILHKENVNWSRRPTC